MMYKFFDKHKTIIIMVSLILILGGGLSKSIVGLAFPGAAEISEEILEVVVGGIIDEKIEPLQSSINRIEKKLSYEKNYPVVLISMEMNKFRTAEEADARMDFLEENCWFSQLAALKYIAANQEAKEALERNIIHDEVYKALLMRL